MQGRPTGLGAVLVGRFLHHPLLSPVLSLGPAAALASLVLWAQGPRGSGPQVLPLVQAAGGLLSNSLSQQAETPSPCLPAGNQASALPLPSPLCIPAQGLL